jgi:hypothetical protein
MAINASAGAQIFIGPVTAAATASAYAALSYTEIGEVESLGEFGDEAETIRFMSLKDRRVRKLKGARDAGDLTLVVGHDPRDAGQTALIAAEAAKFAYAIKVVLPDAPDANDTDSVHYFHALIASKRLGVGSTNDVTKRNFVLAITTAVIEVKSVAVSGP